MNGIDRTKEFYDEIIKILKEGIDEGLTLQELCGRLGLDEGYFHNYRRRVIGEALLINTVTREEHDIFIDLYSRIVKGSKKKDPEKLPAAPLSAEENQSWGVPVRDGDGTVEYYEYSVHDREGNPVTGQISRRLMDRIHAFYTREGINLTRKEASREFIEELNIDLYIFEQILRVFRITKSSTPFSSHVLEETPVEDLIEKPVEIKESLFWKRYEASKAALLEKANRKLLTENHELKNKLSNISEWFGEISFNDVKPAVIHVNGDAKDFALAVFLSDIHIGAMVADESLYENCYNASEVQRRFDIITAKIGEVASSFGLLDRIIVVNLGDSLDGFNNSTARGGHFLPQNMTNIEQCRFYNNLMQQFIGTVRESGLSKHVDFYAVSDSNHDGAAGYAVNYGLAEYFKVKYPGMSAVVFNRFVDMVVYGSHKFLLTHGKDSSDMFKGWPLILDEKTENRIMGFIDEHFDSTIYQDSTVHIIKGDLHQQAVTYGKKIRYRSVGSIMGSSGWIMKNFGNTKPVCDMMVVKKDDRNGIYDTFVRLKN